MCDVGVRAGDNHHEKYTVHDRLKNRAIRAEIFPITDRELVHHQTLEYKGVGSSM